LTNNFRRFENDVDICPTCTYDAQKCSRCQAYDELPKWRWLQAFVTFVVGVPHIGQKPLFTQQSMSVVVMFITMLWLSILTSSAFVMVFPLVSTTIQCLLLVFLTIIMMFTTGLFRAMHNFILHNASHNNFGQYSKFVGELASIIALTQPYNEYLKEHRLHHKCLAESKDPDQQELFRLGFYPGFSLHEYWKRLLLIILTPQYALRDVYERCTVNFGRRQPFYRQVIVSFVHGIPFCIVLTYAFLYGNLQPLWAWLFAWFIPLTYGYFVSKVLYLLSLHKWYCRTKEQGIQAVIAMTGARFFCDACPPQNSSARWIRWFWWWFRFFILHLLLSRLAVIGGTDNSQHDAHHADPNGLVFDWCNSIYSRHELAISGRYANKMWHSWGLFRAINDNFIDMAKGIHNHDPSFINAGREK
jgi:fatty-acid desaturase